MAVSTGALIRRRLNRHNWPWRLWVPAGLMALVLASPLVYLLIQGLAVAPEIWARLLRTRVPSLLTNTLLLTGLVTVGAVGLGLWSAWLVERTDLPARKALGALFVGPLIIPCYLMAIGYMTFLGARGLLERTLQGFGWDVSIPNIYGLGGAVFVLILATYPYVYVIARAAFQRFDGALIDAARSCGAGRWRTTLGITLPLLVPALSAGGVLAALYALSDFGVVTTLRFQTFVSVIYQQLTGRYDPGAAAALGTMLVLLTLLLLWGQARLWGERRFVRDKPSARPLPLVSLGIWKLPALALVAVVLAAGLFLPLGVLVSWLVAGWSTPAAALWGTSGSALLGYVGNSLMVSAAAATLAVLLALPLAYASTRHRDRISRLWAWCSQAGQALPGVLIALGLLFLVLQFLPGLYATVFLVIWAYVVRFFPQALQALGAGLTQIPGRLEEGARLLGHRPLHAFMKITLPLLRPALGAGWILVFLSAVRELPATLLLRPAGFDTLPVRIWTAAGEGFYAQAAPAALLLIGLSIPLLFWLHRDGSSPGSVRSYD
jgi:iron(III) transport system permease protein